MFKRSAVTVAGIALIVGGGALMVLPGPGILLVVAGLAVLATEYVWARRVLGKAREEAAQAQAQAVASPTRTVATQAFAFAMCAVGVAMLFVEDLRWPFWDSFIDSLWTPLTGSIVIVTSLVLVTTTVLALRDSREKRVGSLEP